MCCRRSGAIVHPSSCAVVVRASTGALGSQWRDLVHRQCIDICALLVLTVAALSGLGGRRIAVACPLSVAHLPLLRSQIHRPRARRARRVPVPAIPFFIPILILFLCIHSVLTVRRRQLRVGRSFIRASARSDTQATSTGADAAQAVRASACSRCLPHLPRRCCGCSACCRGIGARRAGSGGVEGGDGQVNERAALVRHRRSHRQGAGAGGGGAEGGGGGQ
jgi:hypothetical protein